MMIIAFKSFYFMIKLEKVSKNFTQNNKTIYALDDISIQVPKGQIYGVIGKSGAGKSTLIRCVNLLEKPTSGKVWIDNQEITHLNNRQLIEVRHKVSMIFQHFNLLSSRTVFENIAFPLELKGENKKLTQQKVTELIKLVGLEEKANVYPSQLSGGQKQRVAIARALASDPKVLLCDEATSALDPETTHSILKLLKTINQKLDLTILLITHEMEVIKQICDQVAIINNGKLIEIASVGEIFSAPKTEISKQFIQSTWQINLPDDYKNKLHNANPNHALNRLVQLKFASVNVDSPLISLLTKNFNIESNIINAQMDYAGGVKFGVMLTELIGTEQDQLKAIDFLEKNNTEVEILGYV